MNLKMKRPLFTGLFATLLLLASCGRQEPAPEAGPLPYPVIEVPRRTVTGYSNWPASIEGVINSAVRAKVSGYITDVLVDEGAKVSAGQPLFKLETATLSQDAEAAAANVHAARVEVQKLIPLVEQGIISQVQLETAKARLAQAEATLSSINATIEYATIRSPVDGYVGAIPYREGALVSPADPQPLTVVADIREVYAFFSMNERDYLDFLLNTEGATLDEKIRNFPPVELVLVNGQIYPHKGRIETVTGQVNRSTGTVSFRATFPNPDRILTNGNSGTIRIPRLWEDAVVVPAASTYERQGMIYLFRVEGDSIAVASPIRVADRIGNILVVESGVEAGDRIVAQGVGLLQNNAPILPRPVSFESIADSLNRVFK